MAVTLVPWLTRGNCSSQVRMQADSAAMPPPKECPTSWTWYLHDGGSWRSWLLIACSEVNGGKTRLRMTDSATTGVASSSTGTSVRCVHVERARKQETKE